METEEKDNMQVAHLKDDLHNLEAYMEEFTDFLPWAVCIVNTKQVIVDTNEAFADVTGFETDAAIGSVLSDFFAEDDLLNNLLTAVSQVADQTRNTRLTLVTKNGQDKKVRVTVGPRRDIHGEHTGYFVGVAPVSAPNTTPIPPAPKKLEVEAGDSSSASVNSAEHEKQKNQAIIDGMRDGFLVIDDEGRVDRINTHAAEVLSVERSDICGQEIESLRDRDELGFLLDQIKANPDEPEKMKIGEQTFEVSIEIANIDNSKSYKLVTLHDISKDEFIEDMKLTFVTVAAHQIRTPLSSIRWSLEILVNQLENEEHKKIARRGFRSTQNVLEIVNALLNLDRLQSGEDGYSFGPVDITEIIERYVDEAQETNRIIDQADINFERPVDPLPKVRADEEKIKIVIRNLIDNALKYTDADGSVNIQSSVHVTNDYGSDVVQIEITDTGIGIPDESQDKIFSKFYRADNATKVKTDGTGIGLYITKQIIEAHDGTIWFESEEGEGTTFYIQLPIAQTQD